MTKIFIVEDDIKMAELIHQSFSTWGFESLVVKDFRDVLGEFSSYSPHLVLLDINLPYYDGFYWCKEIRCVSNIPIIFISSRNENMDLIMAINMGGDDFISKPFSLDVLVTKVNGLLRRTFSYSNSESVFIQHNNVVLNLSNSTISHLGNMLELTKNELKVVHVLLSNHGKIISRERLITSLWNDESFIDENTLTVNINRLRKKLKELGLDELIQTKKNQGYTIL